MDKTIRNMKKIYVIIALLGTMILGACSDFLDETTDKSGSAYIYHMDQLYGLMGSIDLYLFENIDSDTGEGSSSGAYLTEALPLSDAVELSPEFYVYGLLSGEPTNLRGVLLARGDVDDFGLDVMDLDSGLGTDLSFQYGAGVFG